MASNMWESYGFKKLYITYSSYLDLHIQNPRPKHHHKSLIRILENLNLDPNLKRVEPWTFAHIIQVGHI